MYYKTMETSTFIESRFSELPLYCLQKEDPVSDVIVKEDDETSEDRDYHIICRSCSNVLTSPDESIHIDGNHVHKFVNPAGIIFKIRCFKSVPGCIAVGSPTKEFTWFPGFSWSFAICASCLNHLGWFYFSEGNSFFGLILDNIAENRG